MERRALRQREELHGAGRERLLVITIGPVRALGYIRLSRLDKDTTSPTKQREVIQQLCRSRGWTLVQTFEDLDVSGAKESRKGLDSMLARLGDVDAVVTWKLDRLARSLPHLLKLAETFEAADVALVTSDGQVDTTSAAGKAFYGMQGVFSEFERNLIKERIQGTHDRYVLRDASKD